MSMPIRLPETAARFTRAPQNRSLERGVEILRAFRPGNDLLGNGELAERTGLSLATVSRLTQTLVTTGLLEHDRQARAYRLAPPVLSLAHAMRGASPLLSCAAPLMRAASEKLHLNVGLAAPDRDEMVYLESFRYNRRPSLRTVVAGQRVPMELTSLGRANLATCDAAERDRHFAAFKAHRRRGWVALSRAINQSIADVRARDYCSVSWQPQVTAMSTPLIAPGYAPCVLNMSATGEDSAPRFDTAVAEALMALKARILEALARLR